MESSMAGIEGWGAGRSGEEKMQKPETKRAKIDLQGTLHSIHDIASLEKIQTTQYAGIVELVNTVARDLESISATEKKELQRDFTTIDHQLAESEPAKQVKEAIATLLDRLQKGTTHTLDSDTAQEQEIEETVPFSLEGIPEEMRGGIFSHLPETEVVQLQALSPFFKKSATVADARLRHIDTIVQHAIDDTFSEIKPLSSLSETLSLETRLAVRSLSFYGHALTSDDLKTIVELFPNLTTLNLSSCALDDASLTHLPRLTNLQKLEIGWNTTLTGSTFDQLPLSLLELNAVFCALTDENVGFLSRLTNLQRLHIGTNFALTGSTFGQLPRSLLTLVASACALTDANVGLLSRLPSLLELEIGSNPDLTGSTFGKLPKTLLVLDASHCSLTDANVGLLSRLPSLQMLGIKGNGALTGITLDQLPHTLLLLTTGWVRISPEIRKQLMRDRPQLKMW